MIKTWTLAILASLLLNSGLVYTLKNVPEWIAESFQTWQEKPRVLWIDLTEENNNSEHPQTIDLPHSP